jgi:DNA-binding GntR family transcriptional regulator
MARRGVPDPPPSGNQPAARQQVADVLRQGIISGRLIGGTRLAAPRVAQALGVRTPPVRDALRDLAAEGLVQVDLSGVAVVHELSRAELEEIYELRTLLEPIAIGRATKLASSDDLVEAVELLTAMHEVADPGAWSDLNTRFHSVLEEAGSSPLLAAILRNLRALSGLYVTHSLLLQPDRLRAGNAEHREILEAVIGNDPDAAANAVTRHLNGTLNTLLQVREVGGVEAGQGD